MSERRLTSQVPAAVARSAERPAVERLAEQLERSPIVLRDVERGGELPLPRVVGTPPTHEHEASLSEGEPGQKVPERARDGFDCQPFLLIVRTRHVVTIVNARSDVTMSSAGYSDIPAYSRLLQLPGR